MNIRVGFGYDVHQLVPGDHLRLGGVSIPHEKMASGHSDADVLIHAICDALLGAAGMRDIGYHFPNTDPRFKGIDSIKLLEEVRRLLETDGYTIGNIDATAVLERPRIAPHIEAMQEQLARALSISTGQIGLKATTNETMGFTGREEGVAAYAVALISKGV